VTERKPPDASWESWIERLIGEGRRDGAFDDLPGQGRPIDDLDRPHDDLWWVKAKMQREDVAVTPPTIAIRTERDTVVAAAMSATTESEVRELIERLNERIRDLNRFVTWGPPTSVAPLDVDVIVERWRQANPPEPSPPPEPPVPPPPPSRLQRLRGILRRGRRRPPQPRASWRLRTYCVPMELTAEELRVLGCLIEKQATTPDQYPLSTNALVSACNQKSNRDPVVDYSERTVMDASLLVRQEGLARMNSSGRTDKHRHILDDALGLDHDQLAVLAVLMLRGPQSAGELKTRTERYPTSQGTGFESVDDIDAVLAQLAEGADPFVANIGRASGQSQDRWAHLLGDGVPDVNDAPAGPESSSAEHGPSLVQRVEELEARLAVLEDALGMSSTTPEPVED